jgi:hypothetical protein
MNKLTIIQSELKAPKNQFNAFGKYKYRSCEDILEAIKPLLLKHDCRLVIQDEIKEVGSIIYCEARAIFYDGSESFLATAQAGIEPNRKGMDIAQSFGSSSSYARKYALNGLFLIDDTKDPDNDPPPGQNKKTDEVTEAIAKLANCKTVDELKMFKEILPDTVINSEAFKRSGNARYAAITKPKETVS